MDIQLYTQEILVSYVPPSGDSKQKQASRELLPLISVKKCYLSIRRQFPFSRELNETVKKNIKA